MKNTGIIRHIDELGRITLPIELRRSLELDVKDPIQIYLDGDKIVLRKAQLGDIFTGEEEGLIEFEGKFVSRKSIKKLAGLAGYNLVEKQ